MGQGLVQLQFEAISSPSNWAKLNPKNTHLWNWNFSIKISSIVKLNYWISSRPKYQNDIFPESTCNLSFRRRNFTLVVWGRAWPSGAVPTRPVLYLVNFQILKILILESAGMVPFQSHMWQILASVYVVSASDVRYFQTEDNRYNH